MQDYVASAYEGEIDLKQVMDYRKNVKKTLGV